jgi:hypothetical protein
MARDFSTQGSALHRRRTSFLAIALVCGALLAVALGSSSSSSASAAGGPVFSASNPLTFDFVAVGSTSAQKNVTVTNTGDAALTFGAVDLSGRDSADYAIVANGCAGRSLAPRATCSVGVTFSPKTAGTRVTNLRFADNSSCYDWVNIAGSGTQTSAAPTAKAASCSSVTTTVTTPGTTTTTTTPNAPGSGASLISIPKTCTSRRTITIHVKAPKGKTYKQVKIILRGKTVKTLRGKRIATTISLKGLPRGRFTVKVEAQATSGSTYANTRHYVTCVTDKS